MGKIVKMFNLTKDDDVRDYVVRRKVVTKSGNKITKKPKIQRLITPQVLARRKKDKRKVQRRKVESYKKRKAYYDMLAKNARKVKQQKKHIEKAVKQDRKKKSKK